MSDSCSVLLPLIKLEKVQTRFVEASTVYPVSLCLCFSQISITERQSMS